MPGSAGPRGGTGVLPTRTRRSSAPWAWGKGEIFLCLDDQGGRGDHGMWISVWVDDVDAVYATCAREGLEVTSPPEDKPWGVREMHLRHPDGHVFRVSAEAEHE